MPTSDEALWAAEEEEFLASRLAAETPPPKDYDEQELEWLADQMKPAEERRAAVAKRELSDKAESMGKVGAEVAVGMSPAGIAVDVKDMARAVETNDPVLAAMAGIGFIPLIGDMAKGTFKALRAGDRSAETLAAGRRMLEDLPESATEAALEMSSSAKLTGDFDVPTQAKVSAGELEEAIVNTRSGRQVAEYLSEVTENESHRAVLQRIIPHLDDSEVHVVRTDQTGATVIPDFLQGEVSPADVRAWNSVARGGARGVNIMKVDDPVDRILLRGSAMDASGINSTTVTHELLHAATARRMSDARLAANQGTKLQETFIEINDLTRTVSDARKKFMQAEGMSPGQALAAIGGPDVLNPDELIAWGLTDKKFQDFLGTVKIDGENGFKRFVRLLADLLGIPPNEHTALTEIIRLTDELLDAPLDELKRKRFIQELTAGMSG